MARGVPVVRQLDLRLALLGLMPLGILLVISFWLFWPERALLVVVLVWGYVLLALFVRRRLIARHRAGLRAMRRGAWDEAVEHFRAHYDAFARRPDLDRQRWLFLSASSMSHCEMALLNVAFCQAQAGRRAEAQATYERVLVEFPGSPMAITTLNLMRDARDAPAAPPTATSHEPTAAG